MRRARWATRHWILLSTSSGRGTRTDDGRETRAEAPTGLGDPLLARSSSAHGDRALFDLAIDSKLRGCDVVKIRIGDIVAGGHIRDRAMVIQQKTKRPVQFEIVEPARKTLLSWLERQAEPSTIMCFRAGTTTWTI